MQIVVNCETRLCSQFLGPGDNFLQSYGAICTDRAATGSGNLKSSMRTTKSRTPVPMPWVGAAERTHLSRLITCGVLQSDTPT